MSVQSPPWLHFHFELLQLLCFDCNADPDPGPAFHSNADPDLASQSMRNASNNNALRNRLVASVPHVVDPYSDSDPVMGLIICCHSFS